MSALATAARTEATPAPGAAPGALAAGAAGAAVAGREGDRPVAAGLIELLALRVATDAYAIDIMRVREVLRLGVVTPVRGGPPALLGVMPLRDQVVAIVDLRLRLGLPPSDAPGRRVVVVQVARRVVGIVVDQVSEVLRVAPTALRPPPPALPPAQAPFLLGVCVAPPRAFVLLDLRAVVDLERGTP